MFISRFPIFAVLAYLLSLLMVACRPESTISRDSSSSSSSSGDQLTFLHQPEEEPHPHKQSYERRYRLNNRCGGNMQITGKTVHAKRGNFDELVVKTVLLNGQIRLQIQSEKAKSFLCFNKNGKLIARYKYVPEDCTFVEKLDDSHYTELVQERNGKSWHVGFNRKGKTIKGSAYKNKPKRCFQFQKLESLSGSGNGKDSVPPSSLSGVSSPGQHEEEKRLEEVVWKMHHANEHTPPHHHRHHKTQRAAAAAAAAAAADAETLKPRLQQQHVRR